MVTCEIKMVVIYLVNVLYWLTCHEHYLNMAYHMMYDAYF